MIVQGAAQGKLPIGWVETEDWKNPATGERTRKWQGPAATLENAYDEVKKILVDTSGAAIAYAPTVSVAGVLAEVAVVIPPGGGDAVMLAGDIAPPSFSIVPVEYDIPVEQRYVADEDSAANLAYLPALDAALKSADPDEFRSWWDAATPDQRRVAYWRMMGVRTYKSNAYTVSCTRYLPRTQNAQATIYSQVNKVLTWMQLRSLSYVFRAGIAEPKALKPDGTLASLLWLVRPPRVTLKSKWLEVSQNFIGAFRWPKDFYSGGKWESNTGDLDGGSGDAGGGDSSGGSTGGDTGGGDTGGGSGGGNA